MFPEVSAPQPERFEAALQALNALSVDKHCDESALTSPYAPDLSHQLEPVWRQRPAILTFHFGIPPLAFIERAHALGISVGITATCVAEARAIQTAGADFIVAQGWEAGGHRGRFQETSVDEELTLLPLVKALGEDVALPVVAAGGLMTGMDIASVLSAGASAAQLGTAFCAALKPTLLLLIEPCYWTKSRETRRSPALFLGALREAFKISSSKQWTERSCWNFLYKTA